MPVLYAHIPICSDGMVSAQPFSLPADGRRVFFDISPGGAFRKDIFILTDGKFREEAFANGSRLETPIRGLDWLFASPHEAYAIVVDRTEVPLQTIPFRTADIPVTFPDGKNAVIKLSGSLTASIFPQNAALLAKDYADGLISSPEATAAATLKKALQTAAVRYIPAAAGQVSPQAFVGKVDELALELADIAARETERLLPWCRVCASDVCLTVENADQLVQESNAIYDMRTESLRALLNAILSTFGSSPLPPEVSQVLMSYIGSNPGISAAEVQNFCQGIFDICQVTSPQKLLAIYQQVAMLPAAGGI